jgi:hypothetical protein
MNFKFLVRTKKITKCLTLQSKYCKLALQGDQYGVQQNV